MMSLRFSSCAENGNFDRLKFIRISLFYNPFKKKKTREKNLINYTGRDLEE